MKFKTLLLTLFLSTSLIGTTYADFQAGADAFGKGDYKTAFKEFRLSAQQGDASAQFFIGWMYANGKGVLKNDNAAVEWIRKAAEQGYADAQTSLGVKYFNGEGVLTDYKEAIKWFSKAANQEDAKAQLKLGIAYAIGTGVQKDLNKAKYWAEKAYENGKPEVSEQATMLWDAFELWKY
jgi:TPR repeat protein